MPRQYRPQVPLPESLASRLHDAAEASGESVGELCFHWIITAARLAQAGRGHLLPQQRRAPRGSVGPVRTVRWKQSADRFHECRDLIVAAGSSVPAVLREAAEAYLAAGNDAVMMAWPAKRAISKAA